MRKYIAITTTEFHDVCYADVPSTKARLLARGYKVEEIYVSRNSNDKYTVSATRTE